jgi:hypothetical protein
MSNLEAIPINAFFDSTGTGLNEEADFDIRRILTDAEVIIGRDVMTGHEFILYGRDALQRLASDKDPEGVSALCIGLDQDEIGDDLERAIILVEAAKGRHEYDECDSFRLSNGDGQ